MVEDPSRPVLSVVVPVRNGAGQLGDLLDALDRQEGAPPFEVVIVDNGSVDGTVEVAAAHPRADRIVHEPDPGSYRARNAGIAVARADLVAFTDVDCRPDPGWVVAGVAALNAASLVGGRVVQEVGADASPWARYDAGTYLDQEAMVSEQGVAATANLFVRRAVLDSVGWFDPDLESGGDVELCGRARDAGHSLVYESACVVRHRARASAKEMWRLHRRLAAGWGALAARGRRPPAWRDLAMWEPPTWAGERMARSGAPMRFRHLLVVHAFVMAARWVGRLTGGLARSTRRLAAWDPQ